MIEKKYFISCLILLLLIPFIHPIQYLDNFLRPEYDRYVKADDSRINNTEKVVNISINNSYNFKRISSTKASVGIFSNISIININNLLIPDMESDIKRAYLYGMVVGVYSYNRHITPNNITIHIGNITRTYNHSNFPLEDDCISEDKCFVTFVDM